MRKLVRESIGFERGGDPRKTLRVGKLARLKEKYGGEDLDELLAKASRLGNLEDVKFLVQQGADVHYGYVLSQAAVEGHLDIVKYLIEERSVYGYDAHSLDKALAMAAVEDQLDVIKYLYEQGASIHGDNNVGVKWSTQSAMDELLMAAARIGNLEDVKFLVEHGADIHTNNDFALKFGTKDVVDYLKSIIDNE